MDKDRLERQIEFIREIDKEKSIGRQTYLADVVYEMENGRIS